MAEWKDLGNKAMNLTMAGLNKAKELGQSAKLSLDNVSEEENKKKLYLEIGKRFVFEHPVAPAGYEELYEQLKESETRIQENKERLEELRDDE